MFVSYHTETALSVGVFIHQRMLINPHAVSHVSMNICPHSVAHEGIEGSWRAFLMMNSRSLEQILTRSILILRSFIENPTAPVPRRLLFAPLWHAATLSGEVYEHGR
ncbi:hypothetical protein [Sphingobium herbicidovorans]